MVDPLGVLGALSVGIGGLSSVLFFARKLGTHWPTIAAFFIQATLGIGQYLLWGLRDDQLTYFDLANNLAIDLKANPLVASAGIGDGKQSFVWILAITFLIWGSNPLPGLVLNAIMVSALPTILVATGRNLRLFTQGKVTAWISVIGPPILLWGPGLKREPLAFLLLALLLLGLSWAFQGWVLRSIFLIGAASLVLAVTRSSLAAVAVAVAVMALSLVLHRFLLAKRYRLECASTSLDGWIVASMGVSTAFAMMPVAFRIPQVRNVHGSLVELTEGQATAAPYSAWEVENSFPGLLDYVVRAFYNLGRSIVGPMPWEVANLPLVVFFLDGAIYGLLILNVVVLYRSSRDTAGRIVVTILLVVISPLLIANFLYFANYGLTSRVRAHIFVLLLVLIEPVVSNKLGTWWRSFCKLRSIPPVTRGALESSPILRGLGAEPRSRVSANRNRP